MSEGYYKVTFLVRETGAVVTRTFQEYLPCWKFVNKLKYSKRCRLISYPLFKD